MNLDEICGQLRRQAKALRDLATRRGEEAEALEAQAAEIDAIAEGLNCPPAARPDTS